MKAMGGSSTGCVDTGSGCGGETTTATTAPPAPTTTQDPNLKRTVIFHKAITLPGEDLFILGGISHNQRSGCTSNADTSDCAIYISHNSLGTTSHYDKINAWSVNNNRLNWYGAQTNQGTYEGVPAEGTPLVWTSSSSSNPGYQPDNTWGDHYWKVDFTMDCSETENDWFEFKGFVSNGAGWEADISQGACDGTVGGTAPYSSTNHMARCGYLNVFEFGLSSCIINNF